MDKWVISNRAASKLRHLNSVKSNALKFSMYTCLLHYMQHTDLKHIASEIWVSVGLYIYKTNNHTLCVLWSHYPLETDKIRRILSDQLLRLDD